MTLNRAAPRWSRTQKAPVKPIGQGQLDRGLGGGVEIGRIAGDAAALHVGRGDQMMGDEQGGGREQDQRAATGRAGPEAYRRSGGRCRAGPAGPGRRRPRPSRSRGSRGAGGRRPPASTIGRKATTSSSGPNSRGWVAAPGRRRRPTARCSRTGRDPAAGRWPAGWGPAGGAVSRRGCRGPCRFGAFRSCVQLPASRHLTRFPFPWEEAALEFAGYPCIERAFSVVAPVAAVLSENFGAWGSPRP